MKLERAGDSEHTALTCRQSYCLFRQMESQVRSILLRRNTCV